MPAPEWKRSIAFRWRKRGGHGYLQPVTHLHRIRLDDLRGIDAQKRLVEQNTRQFVQGLPANNVLQVTAQADGMPLLPEDPQNGANRRIELLLLTDSAEQLYRQLFSDEQARVQVDSEGAKFSGGQGASAAKP